MGGAVTRCVSWLTRTWLCLSPRGGGIVHSVARGCRGALACANARAGALVRRCLGEREACEAFFHCCTCSLCAMLVNVVSPRKLPLFFRRRSVVVHGRGILIAQQPPACKVARARFGRRSQAGDVAAGAWPGLRFACFPRSIDVLRLVLHVCSVSPASSGLWHWTSPYDVVRVWHALVMCVGVSRCSVGACALSTSSWRRLR